MFRRKSSYTSDFHCQHSVAISPRLKYTKYVGGRGPAWTPLWELTALLKVEALLSSGGPAVRAARGRSHFCRPYCSNFVGLYICMLSCLAKVPQSGTTVPFPLVSSAAPIRFQTNAAIGSALTATQTRIYSSGR